MEENETDLMMSDYYKAYESFGNTIDFLPIYYTASAVILNPIPRFMWQEKPVGVGRILAVTRNGQKDYTTKELLEIPSSFAIGICGEGWVNGGIFGVVLYSILLGLIAGMYTSMYYTFLMRNTYMSLMIALLCYRAASSFIRGDILSGITSTTYPLIFVVILLTFVAYIGRSRIS